MNTDLVLFACGQHAFFAALDWARLRIRSPLLRIAFTWTVLTFCLPVMYAFLMTRWREMWTTALNKMVYASCVYVIARRFYVETDPQYVRNYAFGRRSAPCSRT